MASWNTLDPSGEEEWNAMKPRVVKASAPQPAPLSRAEAASAIHKITNATVAHNLNKLDPPQFIDHGDGSYTLVPQGYMIMGGAIMAKSFEWPAVPVDCDAIGYAPYDDPWYPTE